VFLPNNILSNLFIVHENIKGSNASNCMIRAGLKLMQPMQLQYIVPRAPGGPALWWLDRFFIFARYSFRSKIV